MALPVSEKLEIKPGKIDPWKVSNNQRMEMVKDEFVHQQKMMGFSPKKEGLIIGTVTRYKDPPYYTQIDYVNNNSYLVWVYSKMVTTAFGTQVPVYYYLCYRNYWSTKWASRGFADLPNYNRKEGNIFPVELLGKLEKDHLHSTDNRIDQSVIVLGILDDNRIQNKIPPEIWYANARNVITFVDGHGGDKERDSENKDPNGGGKDGPGCRFWTIFHTHVFGCPKDKYFELKDVYR